MQVSEDIGTVEGVLGFPMDSATDNNQGTFHAPDFFAWGREGDAADLTDLCVRPENSILEAIGCINRNEKGIVLVTDAGRHILGSIVDGDVRRAIIAGMTVESPVSDVLKFKREKGAGHRLPVTAPAGTTHDDLLLMMKGFMVRQIPLVDRDGRMVDLVTIHDLLPKENVSRAPLYDPRDLCVSPDDSLRQVLQCIDRNEKGIVLVTDEGHKLLGVLTDGDVRRALLAGKTTAETAGRLLSFKKESSGSTDSKPVTAPLGSDREMLLRMMEQRKVRQIPLEDEAGCVAGLVSLDDLLKDNAPLPVTAVIMAGGFGTRLQPLTDDIPKPMLPIGQDRPLLEVIVKQLRQAGIRRMNITTHFLPEKIKDHFGNGRRLGVDIRYVQEEKPLGTAGALGLLDYPEEPLLVINGDILTQVGFKAMFDYHRFHGADLTVAVRQHDTQVPYGVVECDGPNVRALQEKPRYSYLVNAGIYLLQPAVHRYIPEGERFDMTDLIERLLKEGRSVVCFPIFEYWMDIGRHLDYQKAREDYRNGGFL